MSLLLVIKYFCPFLNDIHFIIVANFSSLKCLQKMKDPNSWLAYWALKSQHYDFLIVHSASAIHQNTKCLSCLHFLAYMAPKENQVFDLLGRPDLWHLNPQPIQTHLNSMSASAHIKVRLLYKLVSPAWIP